MSVPENETEKVTTEATTPAEETQLNTKETSTTAENAAPTPSAVAKKSAEPVVRVTYSEEDVATAKTFASVHDGSVFVKDGDQEREVGKYAEGEEETALNLLARRYLDLRARLELFAQRLKASQIRSREIDQTVESLKKDVEAPQVVGDLTALRNRMDELAKVAEQKKARLEAARKRALDKSIAEHTAVIEKAEALVAGLNDNTNWRDTAEKFRAIFDEWKETQKKNAHLDRKTSDALWKRFSATRSQFNRQRRQWAKQRDEAREAVLSKKRAIVKRAEELKDSTDWLDTSHEFANLMNEWKNAGRAGRRDDDKLWTQFRAAADTFFNARQADRDQRNAGQEENLEKKRALLAKAQQLLPVTTEQQAAAARQALGKILEEWDQIGYVPRQNIRELEDGLNAVEQQIKAVEEAVWRQKDPETSARRNSFEDQLNARIAELDELIASEKDEKKKAEYESEKAAKLSWLAAVSK